MANPPNSRDELYRQLAAQQAADIAAAASASPPQPQPVLITTVPLPAGASTEIAQASQGVTLGAIADSLANPASVGASVSVTNFPATQPVSISGAVPVTGTFWQATQPISGSVSFSGSLPAGTNLIGHVIVDSGAVNVGNFPASQAVTGTFWQNTQPISAASLPLPTGAMQQTGGTVGLVAGSAVIGHVIVDSGSLAVSGTFWQTTQPVSIASMPSTPVTGTFWQSTQPVSATALPLPSGAATDTNISAALAKTLTTQELATSSPDLDGLVEAVNKMLLLLMSIDIRLKELPLNLNIALNAGVIKGTLPSDEFNAIRDDLANIVYNS